jgi:hypothetical protein
MGALMRTRPQESDDARRHCLLPPPAFHERRHRGLARRLIAMRGAADVAVVAARPHPMMVLRRDRHLEDAADDDAVLDHVKVVLSSRWARV